MTNQRLPAIVDYSNPVHRRVLAKHHVAIGVSVPEVVPDGTGNLAKCWSEWQDLQFFL
jgi:hypothetical protein